jgi:hypothetical protein
VFDDVAAQVPVDLAGMNGEGYHRWLGDVRLSELHARAAVLPRVLQPDPLHLAGAGRLRGDGDGPADCGPRDDRDGHGRAQRRNGYVETDPIKLVGHLRRLLADRDEAAELSAGARRVARERFGIERFPSDWTAVLRKAAGREGGDDPVADRVRL